MFEMIIGSIVGFILGFVTNEVYFRRSKELSLKLMNLQRVRDVPQVNASPLTVYDGDTSFQITKPGTGVPIRVLPDSPSIHVTSEGRILINGEIRDETGAIVAELKDSQLFVLLGADYDINSDSSGLEVVDEQLRPVLQLYQKNDPTVLQITYVTFCKPSKDGSIRLVVCHEGGTQGGTKEFAQATRNSLKRIFQYPGHKYPGVRRSA